MAERAELLRNAVAFLADPQTQSSPIVQRVQFLESRGLTPQEITHAFALAHQQLHGPLAGPHQQPSSIYGPPPNQPWDWRDYFITAIVSGSVMLGTYTLAKKYLFPHLTPPTLSAYEQDKVDLTAQFDAAQKLLEEIQAETTQMKGTIEEQRQKVDEAVEQVNTVVEKMKTGEDEVRDEMREIRQEVNNMREMLPKMLDRVKEQQTTSYTELQQELKSVKTLLLSSRPEGSGLPSPMGLAGSLPRKPTIPAWQLSTPSSAAPSIPSTPPPFPPLASPAPE